jgi:hypothetical protein
LQPDDISAPPLSPIGANLVRITLNPDDERLISAKQAAAGQGKADR